MVFRHWQCGTSRMAALLVTFLTDLIPASHPARALIITPTFDTSITTAPNAATIEGSILRVIGAYENLVADPINVSVDFRRGLLPSNLASQSAASLYAVPYAPYTNLLAANAAVSGNPILTTAVANLQSGNMAPLVVVSSAALRALGDSAAQGLLGADQVRGHGTLDGVITLSTGIDFQFSRPVPSGQIDAQWAIAHEIDEVLGIGGAAGSILNAAFDSGQTMPPFFGGVIGNEDLYRYAGPNTPSLTINGQAIAFFSIDAGRTNLARFNQDHTLDYADWFAQGPCMPLVQRATFCPGLAVDVTGDCSPEAVALQAIGYDLALIPEPATALAPEPATALILLAGLGGLALLLSKKMTLSRR